MSFQTNNTALFSVSSRFVWVPAVHWFHPAVFHNSSVLTHPHLPLHQRDHLLYLTWSHLCSPAGLAAPPRTQHLGGQSLSCAFPSLGISSHNPRCSSRGGCQSPWPQDRLCERRRVFPLFIWTHCFLWEAYPANKSQNYTFWEVLSQGLKPPCTLFVWASFEGMGRKGRSKDVILACQLCSVTRKQCDNANPV